MRRFVLHIICLLLVLSGWLAPQQVQGQIIDTAMNPYVTTSDSINKMLQILHGMNVRIIAPKVKNYKFKGKKVKVNFKKYYVYVVKAQDIFINNARLANRGTPTFVIIISNVKKLTEPIKEINCMATYMKAVVDYSDSLNIIEGRLKMELNYIDSLRWYVEDNPKVDPTIKKAYEASITRAKKLKQTYDFYKDFKKLAKSKKKILNFFYSNHFRTTFKYNVVQMPLGMPQYFVEEDPDPSSSKHKVKGKKKGGGGGGPPDDQAPPPPSSGSGTGAPPAPPK